MRKIRLLVLLILALQAISSKGSTVNHSARELSRMGIRRVAFNANRMRNGAMYYTNLEQLRNFVVLLRNVSLNYALSRLDQLMASNKAEGKLQQPVPEQVAFPCDLSKARSPEPPKLISRLRPGDIDIVAAFGESITAGNGLLSQSFIDVGSEFRGFTYTGGGLGSWRTSLTLPNILKLYNPQLYGYARTHGLVADADRSVFNIAEPMLTMRDLPFQAHVLINRMRSDPRVDMQRHWKLLTIHLVFNDVCFELCSWDDTEAYLRLQRQQAYRALAMLRDEVPRLMINWVLLPDAGDFQRTLNGFPWHCNLRLICSCMTGMFRPHYPDALRRLQDMQRELAALPEFRQDDFVIVLHELQRNMSGIVFTHGSVDMRYFTHDCMHYSQRLHAVMASALWNSMLQPIDTRTAWNWRRPLQHLMCPSAERPFLRIS